MEQNLKLNNEVLNKESSDNKAPDNRVSDNEDLNKQFHPAFCDAMTQIFEHDTARYEYEREYNLNSMPNRIDFLVIKLDEEQVMIHENAKNKGIDHSENGISRLCRHYNIFEYKSPGQQLSVDEYYVAMAYAYLYAGKTKNVSMEDMTISFVREGKPKKLISFFQENGHHIIEYEKGIYHILKKDHVDMQIVVTREIDDKYIWLKALSDKLTLDDARRLAADAEKEKDDEGRKRIRSILDLVSRLNRDKDWMKEMKSMGAFRDLFKEEFEEKDKKIQDLSEQLQSKNEELQSKDKQLQSKDKELQSKDEQLQSKDEELQSKDEQLESKDEELQSKDEQLQSKDKELQSKDEQLQSKDEQLQSKEEQLQSKEEQLQSKDKQLQSKDKEVKSLKKELEYIKEQMKNNKIAIL